MSKQVLFKKKYVFLACITSQIFVMRKCLCINYSVLKIGGYTRNKNMSRPLTGSGRLGQCWRIHTHIIFIDKLQHLPVSKVLKLESLYHMWSQRLRAIFHRWGKILNPWVYLAVDHLKIYHVASLHQWAVLSIPKITISYIHCAMQAEVKIFNTLKHLTLLR